MLTAEVFFKLKKDCFGNSIGASYHNVLYGIGTDCTLYSESPELTAHPQDCYAYSRGVGDEYRDYFNGSSDYMTTSAPKPSASMYYDRSMVSLYPRPNPYMMSQYYPQSYMNGNPQPAMNGFSDHATK